MNAASASPAEVARRHALTNIAGGLLPLWVAVIAVTLVIRVLVSYFNAFDTSVWAAIAPTTKVFLGVLGIIVPTLIMPWYITHGITRKHFNGAVAGAIGGVAVFLGVVLIAGFAVEEMVFNATGTAEALENFNVFDSFSRVALVYSSFALVWAGWFTSGWLVGAGYYRFGGGGGTLFLPVALLPAGLAEFLVGVDWGWNPSEISGPVHVYMSIPGWITGDLEFPYASGAIVALLIVLASMWFCHHLLRNVAIK